MFKIGDFAKLKVGYIEEMSKDPFFRAMMGDGHIVKITEELYKGRYSVRSITIPVSGDVKQELLEPATQEEVDKALATGEPESGLSFLARMIDEITSKKGKV